MRYKIDHDLHIHTCLSICSDDDGQTPDNILQIAKKRGLKTICVTDHYWDDAVKCNTAVNWWYEEQNYPHISKAIPLPKEEGVTFLFGCETDMDSSYEVGIPKERFQDFGFIIVSTTHFHHMTGEEWQEKTPESLARIWVRRLESLLNKDLPFEKVGVAHLACALMNLESREKYLETLDAIPTEDMQRLFAKAAKLGVGIELNFGDMNFAENEAERVLRMFKIAKDCGCKFYLGSDAHERYAFEGADEVFERAITLLDLKETDKFMIQ